jgi:hypothetical protein
MATTEIAARKLGKITPRVDVRTLTLSRYIDRAQLPDPPRPSTSQTTSPSGRCTRTIASATARRPRRRT